MPTRVDLPWRDDQSAALDVILTQNGCNLFAKPGNGKTRVALEAIYHTDVRTLVIAPLFASQVVWPAEWKKWGYDQDFSLRVLHGKERKAGSEDVSVISYEGLAWLKEQPKLLSSYDFVVYDEVSKMKNAGSKRFRQWRRPARDFEYRLGLTGTPVGNKLIDLWGEMYVADLGATLGTRIIDYKQEYFYSHPHIDHVWLPKDGTADRVFKLIQPSSFIVNHRPDMPELIHNKLDIEIPAKARQAYAAMQDQSLLEMGADTVYASNAAVRAGKLRQLASGAVYAEDGITGAAVIKSMHTRKAQVLRDLIEESQGDPVLVFFEYSHDLDTIRQVCGDDIPSLDGRTKTADMVSIVDRWNAGDIPVLAAHPLTAGMGGNLQESGSTVVFYTLPWSLEAVEQCIGRVWRTGQKNTVVVHYLCVTDSMDQHVFDVVKAKEETQNALFDQHAYGV